MAPQREGVWGLVPVRILSHGRFRGGAEGNVEALFQLVLRESRPQQFGRYQKCADARIAKGLSPAPCRDKTDIQPEKGNQGWRILEADVEWATSLPKGRFGVLVENQTWIREFSPRVKEWIKKRFGDRNGGPP